MGNLVSEIHSFIHAIGKTGESRLEAAGIPINLKHHFMLTMLIRTDDMIQTDIADAMKRDKSAILREIDLMEKLGYVERQNDATDRRKKRLLITESGREIHAKTQRIIEQVISDLFQGVSQEDYEAFQKVIKQVVFNSNENSI